MEFRVCFCFSGTNCLRGCCRCWGLGRSECSDRGVGPGLTFACCGYRCRWWVWGSFGPYLGFLLGLLELAVVLVAVLGCMI